VLKADKTNDAPEVDELLTELGRTTLALPYYGLFQPGEDPIHFDGIFATPNSFLDQLGAKQLSEAWAKSKKTQINLEETSQPQRVVRLPEAAAN